MVTQQGINYAKLRACEARSLGDFNSANYWEQQLRLRQAELDNIREAEPVTWDAGEVLRALMLSIDKAINRTYDYGYESGRKDERKYIKTRLPKNCSDVE